MKKVVELQNRINKLARIKLARLPTPLEKMPNLRKVFNGPQLWIKRDDLTGIAFGGNKERKVEFIMADAIQKGADIIITAGDIQSNHARVVSAAARKLGLKTVLVIKGKEPREHDGNLFLDRLFGAEIRFVQGEWQQIVVVTKELVDELKRKGHKPYMIPNSGSYPIGAIGYFNAMLELVKQAEKANFNIDYIIHASGSGGTQAGLILANKVLDTRVKILGIGVESNINQWLAEKIMENANGLAKLLELEVGINDEDMVLIEDYVGKGYGVITPKIVETIELVAQSEGILLDPVYTSKAMIGLIDLIKKKRFKEEENVVFIHTGGTPTLFAYREHFGKR